MRVRHYGMLVVFAVVVVAQLASMARNAEAKAITMSLTFETPNNQPQGPSVYTTIVENLVNPAIVSICVDAGTTELDVLVSPARVKLVIGTPPTGSTPVNASDIPDIVAANEGVFIARVGAGGCKLFEGRFIAVRPVADGSTSATAEVSR